MGVGAKQAQTSVIGGKRTIQLNTDYRFMVGNASKCNGLFILRDNHALFIFYSLCV